MKNYFDFFWPLVENFFWSFPIIPNSVPPRYNTSRVLQTCVVNFVSQKVQNFGQILINNWIIFKKKFFQCFALPKPAMFLPGCKGKKSIFRIFQKKNYYIQIMQGFLIFFFVCFKKIQLEMCQIVINFFFRSLGDLLSIKGIFEMAIAPTISKNS